MPTYDYECAKCGHRFDAFQSMSDDPLRKCPSCGKAGLRRLIGGGLGVIFKGSGFYVTDSRSGGNGGDRTTKTDKDSTPAESTSGSSSSPASGESSSSTSAKSDDSSSSAGKNDSGKQKPSAASKAAT